LDVEAIRGHAEELGSKGSFFHDLRAVSEKSLANLTEVSQRNPLAATITGGLVGAGVGASSGPALAGAVRDIGKQFSRIHRLNMAKA
jgi:hypothetical protein